MRPPRLSVDDLRSRVGIGWQGAALCVVLPSLCLGLCLIVSPWPTVILGAAVTALLLVAFPLRQYMLGVLLTLIMVVPADYMPDLFGPPRGIFGLGVSCLFLCAMVLRGHKPQWHWREYDVYILIASTALSIVISVDPTQSRPLVFWATALLVLGILNGSVISARQSAQSQIIAAILIAGSMSAIVGWIEYLGFFPTGVSNYYPSQTIYTPFFRASGLNGHPLRLGSISMLGTFFGSYIVVNRTTSGGVRILSGAGTLLCFTALIMSGARGAWIGLIMAALVCVACELQSSKGVVVRLVIMGVVLLGLVSITGLTNVIVERTVGEAMAPQSLEQRVQAAEVVSRAWMDAPMFGIGPAGVEGRLYVAGLFLPNIENDYLIALLSGGLVGFAALLFLVGRRIILAMRIPTVQTRALVLSPLAALFADMGTYNFLTWSSGATIVVCLLWLVWQNCPVDGKPGPTWGPRSMWQSMIAGS